MLLPMNKRDRDRRWVPSADVLEAVIDILGRRGKALHLLDSRLSAERWRARADNGQREIDYGPLPRRFSNENRRWEYSNYDYGGVPVAVSPQFWTGPSRSCRGIDLWNWSDGIFAYVEHVPDGVVKFDHDDSWYIKAPQRWTIFNVCFDAQSIDSLLGDLKSLKERAKPPMSKPRIKKRPWAPILLRLEAEVESGEISRLGDLQSRGILARIEAEIQKAMLEEHGEEAPPSTVRAKAQTIRNAWRKKSGVHPDHPPG